MTQNHSKLRQQAEVSFAKAQSQYLARDRVVAEADLIAEANKEKTARLKKARLAKKAEEQAVMDAALVQSQAGKT